MRTGTFRKWWTGISGLLFMWQVAGLELADEEALSNWTLQIRLTFGRADCSAELHLSDPIYLQHTSLCFFVVILHWLFCRSLCNSLLIPFWMPEASLWVRLSEPCPVAASKPLGVINPGCWLIYLLWYCAIKDSWKPAEYFNRWLTYSYLSSD